MSKEKGHIKLVPELRFSEFEKDGEWKVDLLGNLASFSKGKGISKSDITSDGTQPCIRYGELYTHYNEVIDTVISKTNLPIEKLVLSHENDVIIPSSGETQEDIATASCVTGKDIALGGDINIIRSNLNGIFLSYYLNNAKKREIAKIAQGNTVVHLYSSQLEKLEIEIPEPNEQQKIANTLTSLDNLIQTQSEKIEALKAHKKGLLQQLFPTERESVPQLRFSEFGNSWNYTSLNDIIGLLSGYPFKSKHFTREGKKLLMPKNFTSEGRANFNSGNSKFTSENVDSKYICKSGDLMLLLTDLTPSCELLGKPILMKEKDGEALLNQRIAKVLPSPKVEIEFLLYFFLTESFHNRIKNTATGSTVRHSSNKIILDSKIFLPPIPEQRKIADCLSFLDNMIVAQSEKIVALKEHKKGLMQQLFPNLK